MADEPYDAWRDFEGPIGPEGTELEPPDPESPESNEDRYRDVINEEAERLPPEDPVIEWPSGAECPECGRKILADVGFCDGCSRYLHAECRKRCDRCEDDYCSGCFIGELCSGCYDDRRSGEYSRGGATREV